MRAVDLTQKIVHHHVRCIEHNDKHIQALIRLEKLENFLDELGFDFGHSNPLTCICNEQPSLNMLNELLEA